MCANTSHFAGYLLLAKKKFSLRSDPEIQKKRSGECGNVATVPTSQAVIRKYFVKPPSALTNYLLTAILNERLGSPVNVIPKTKTTECQSSCPFELETFSDFGLMVFLVHGTFWRGHKAHSIIG